eukprot:m.699079 g.699079  ORF g.699079 m.699079 type:complete len:66 (+) comp22903_c0_seq56:722-919(+)
MMGMDVEHLQWGVLHIASVVVVHSAMLHMRCLWKMLAPVRKTTVSECAWEYVSLKYDQRRALERI